MKKANAKVRRILLGFTFMLLFFCRAANSRDNPIDALAGTSSMAEREAAEDRLLEMGYDAVPLLLDGLTVPDKTTRIKCIRLLGDLRVKEAVGPILEELKDGNDPRIVLAASYALGQIKDKRVTKTILRLARDKDKASLQRVGSILCLGFIGDVNSAQGLESVLSDNSEILRVFAASSLGMLGSPKGLNVALKATESGDPSARMHAVEALGLIDDEAAVETLNQIVAGEAPRIIRETAELALLQTKVRDLPRAEKLKVFKEKACDRRLPRGMQIWCINELAKLADSDAKQTLDEIVQSEAPKAVRTHAIKRRRIMRILESGREGGRRK